MDISTIQQTLKQKTANFYSRMIASRESKVNEPSSKYMADNIFPATVAVDTSLKQVMPDKAFF
ncbi:hypothetical protein [Chitinophaga sp.]|uniref:hypothetical protein n=1 Tax=Chitinophaga sp. TaxID=1869181 RepID=UPI0031DE2C7C